MVKLVSRGLLGACALLLAAFPAYAQFSPTKNASISTVDASGERVSLGANLTVNDQVILARNTGTTDMYVKLGDSTVTAATTDTLVRAGETLPLIRGGSTNIGAITASGSTSLSVSTGSG